MLYEKVLASQHGPHEIQVRHFADGTVELWLPGMATPVIIKENGVVIQFSVPGPPVPIMARALWLKPTEKK
jgi:hypothetical protein